MNFEYNPNESIEEPKEMGSFGIDKEVEDRIIEKMKGGFDDSAIVLAKENSVDNETLRKIAKQDIFDNFEKRNHQDSLLKIEKYQLEEIMDDERFIELGKERIVLKLSQGDVAAAYEVLQDLNIDESFFETEEAKRGAENGIQTVLSVDDTEKAIKIQKAFDIDDSFMADAVKSEIKMRFTEDLVAGAISLQNKFGIDQNFMQETIKEEVIARLSFGNSFSSINRLIEKIEMDVSFLNDPKVKEAIKLRIDSLGENKGGEVVPDVFKKIVVEEGIGENA